MSLGQVAEAVLVGRERQSMDPGDQFRDVHDLLDLCSNFVCLEGETPKWYSDLSFREQYYRENPPPSDAYLVLRLAHASVKEYILSDRTSTTSLSIHRLTSGIAQRFMAESCLIYLNQFNDESLCVAEIPRKHQFLFYTTRYWLFHYNDMPAEEEDNVVDLLLHFINTHSNGYAYRNWLASRAASGGYANMRQRPLAAFSCLRAYRVVDAIIENAAKLHVSKHEIKESLDWTAGRGHEYLLRMLSMLKPDEPCWRSLTLRH